MEKEQKRKLYKMGLPIIMGTILLLGVSYAWLSLTLNGTKTNVLKAGTLSLTLTDTATAGINMEGAVPMLDEVGVTTSPYSFTLKNNGTIDSEYTIYLDDVALSSGETKLPDTVIKYNLVKDGVSKATKLLDTTGVNPNRVLDSGVIKPNETYNYDLRLWINQYATNTIAGKVFKGKIRVEASQKIIGSLAQILPREIGSAGSVNTTTVANTTLIQGSNPNNYVWYSGMLWRAMTIDSQQNVRLIYNGEITPWYYGPAEGAQTWETSTAYDYLNHYFYDRLDSSKSTVVSPSNICLDTAVDSNSARTECSNSTTSNVVLPTLDEFNLIANGQDNHYLLSRSGSQELFWFATANGDGSGMFAYTGDVSSSNPAYGPSFAYRPIITLNKNAVIASGNGKKDTPYRIQGDSIGTKDSNISERHSGEYVKYDNKLWRIIEQDSQGTKIIYSGEQQLYFGPHTTYASSNADQLQSTITDKSKLVQDATWYMGEEYDSTKTPMTSTLKAVNPMVATVGLPRIGELFAVDHESWSLRCPYITSYWYLNTAMDIEESHNANPVVYLKGNSKIASGDGTITNPYTLS